MRHIQFLSPVTCSAICGMAAPIIFAITVLIVGFLTPGYNPVTQLISELGIPGGPYAAVMNGIGFILVGVLLISFAYAVNRVFKQGWKVVFGSFMVAVAGLSFVAMGFYHCDQGCIPTTMAGNLHLLFGLIGIVAALLTALIFSLVMYQENGWEVYWQYSLLTGILVFAMLPIFLSLKDIAGLLQRIMVGIIFIWTEVIAIRIVFIASPSRR